MTESANIDLNKLSEQELQRLIEQSKKQMQKLKKQKSATLNSRDPDVAIAADTVRNLAKQKKVTPAVALAAVAKNMRIAIQTKRKARAETAVKYRHPDFPEKTWKGAGKRPLWLVEELNKGRSLDEFKVD